MTIARRSLGFGTLLLSILGLTVCLVGIVGVWMVKSRVEAVSDAALEAADQSLAFSWTMLSSCRTVAASMLSVP